MTQVKLLDCTFRDGGYYNNWDFPQDMIEDYLKAMHAISADYVEIGFRTLNKNGYKGGCAYSTDNFIRNLKIPKNMKIGIMINANELVQHSEGVVDALQQICGPASESPVTLVRIACHIHEIESTLPGVTWLKNQGYLVGINLMQIADRTKEEIANIAKMANDYPLDVLYFADSLGSLTPDRTAEIVHIIRSEWDGEIGIHTHDNMGHALANSMRAIKEGVTWVDGTVTGMGRGPGNVKTENLAIEIEPFRDVPSNITQLLGVINNYFSPLQKKYNWGSNTFYFLAGKYGIHPTYIQEMLNDTRYDVEDILAIIDNLKNNNGKRFSLANLESAKQFYQKEPTGTWSPKEILQDREILLLGTGPGVKKHKKTLEDYIVARKPVVIALNTQNDINPELIDIRTACHPVRLYSDVDEHKMLPQPLVTPVSYLPNKVQEKFGDKLLFDFGLQVKEGTFIFGDKYCVLPNSKAISYTLAIAASGKARHVLLAGFDGYEADDPRNKEVDGIFNLYLKTPGSVPLYAITPTRYQIPESSVYSLI